MSENVTQHDDACDDDEGAEDDVGERQGGDGFVRDDPETLGVKSCADGSEQL